MRAFRTAASRPRRVSGQALIEFAFIALIVVILMGIALSFGLLLLGAHVLQQAADVGAMELARFPASPTASFEEALEASGLYEEALLVVDPDDEDFDVNSLPLINRLLYPLYIYDPDIDRVRYPGALVENSQGQQTVVIPLIGFGNRDPDTGVETISGWRKVVEEILPQSAQEGPYAVDSPTPGGLEPGMVALRINYPYQSGALVAYMHKNTDGDLLQPVEVIGERSVTNVPIRAADESVQGADNATFPNAQTLEEAGYTLVAPASNPAFDATAHRGSYGLGGLWTRQRDNDDPEIEKPVLVRPYRKLLSAQGIYRREVFE